MKTIKLTKGYEAMVDDEDYDKINMFKWYTRKELHQCYAIRNTINTEYINGKSKTFFMHHIILPKKNGLEIDHIDGNGLNNCKINLRYATHSQNGMNSRRRKKFKSNYKGVFREERWRSHRFYAYIYLDIDKRRKYLGSFDNEISAALAYDFWAVYYFSEFANTNLLMWRNNEL